MTVYILYSADYELFLGGNYCDEKEVLIDPTYNLLNICDRLKIPLTLFVDIFSILRYKEFNLFSFPIAAENQLKDAIHRGHDVQSHVHPHWNFTRIEDNKYIVNGDYFLLGKLDTDKEALYEKILTYLEISRNYLHNLLRQVTSDYHCIAFRSGGYGLQPNAPIVLKALKDAGFIIDSSIIPGLVDRNNVNEIDFSFVPKKSNYYLDNNLNSPSENNSGIFEIPIASCTLSLGETFLFQLSIIFNYASNKKNRKTTNFPQRLKGYPFHFQQNTYPQNENPYYLSKFYKFLREFYYDRFLELDCSTNHEKMILCTKKYLKQFDCDHDTIFFSCNMHPKMMTDEHFRALEKYHTILKQYFQENIQAISYQQAAEIIKNKEVFSFEQSEPRVNHS
jgi:hypothetical protein